MTDKPLSLQVQQFKVVLERMKSGTIPTPVDLQAAKGIFYVYNFDDGHRGFNDGCILWWRQFWHGYTTNLLDAGLFVKGAVVNGLANYPPKEANWVPVEKAWAAGRREVSVWEKSLRELSA